MYEMSVINNPSVFADPLLCIMINYLHGGPIVITKRIPEGKLEARNCFFFSKKQVDDITEAVVKAGGVVTAINSDRTRINQSLFKRFKPKGENNIFVLIALRLHASTENFSKFFR